MKLTIILEYTEPVTKKTRDDVYVGVDTAVREAVAKLWVEQKVVDGYKLKVTNL